MLTRKQLSRALPQWNAASGLSRMIIPRRLHLNSSRRLLTEWPRPWKRPSIDRLAQERQDRQLATTVEDFSPYAGMRVGGGAGGRDGELPPPVTFEANRFDPSNPLMIPRITPIPRQRTTPGAAIPGDVDELFPYFDACLLIGKVRRAGLVLRRLTDIATSAGAAGRLGNDLVVLHNRYLHAMLDQLRHAHDQGQAEELHDWYEKYIRHPSLPQTAETVACMVKATLLSEISPRKEMLVRRYMSMAPGQDGYDVLMMDHVINDQDLAVIVGICPAYGSIGNELLPLPDEDLEPHEAGADPESATARPPQSPATTATATDTTAAATTGSADHVPEVLPTPQEGYGLLGLKKSLALFDAIPQDSDFSQLPPREQREIQARLELDSIEAAMARWRRDAESLHKIGISSSISNPSIKHRMYEWHASLVAEIKAEIELCEMAELAENKSQDDYSRCLYGAFLRQGDVQRLAAVTLLSVFNVACINGADKGMPLTSAVISLGKAIEEDIKAQETERRAKQVERARKRLRKDPLAILTEEEQTLLREQEAKWRARQQRAVIRRAAEAAARASAKANDADTATSVPDADTGAEFAAASTKKNAVDIDTATAAPAANTPTPGMALADTSTAKTAAATPAADTAINPDTVTTAADIAATLKEYPGKPGGRILATPLDPDLDRIHPKREQRVRSWPDKIRVKVGAALLGALIKTALVKVVHENPDGILVHEMQPAFAHATQLRRGKKIGTFVMHRQLIEIMKQEPPGELMAKHLPMVVPPRRWKNQGSGGFLESAVSMVRYKYGDRDQRIYTDAAIQRGDMDQVLAGLDILGKTGWRINRAVFDVMLEAWNTGESIAGLPPRDPVIETPEEPETEDPFVRRRWIRAVKNAENQRSSLHSVRCFINFQLEIARAFRNQTFYFPHNLDFRGRAYPMPTYLNHMGADHVRGLLKFAEGRPLGARGLTWLKVHLANLYGYDKASLSEREEFAMDHLPDVHDSAERPLNGRLWWMGAEDPWQCLATCIELRNALAAADPASYVSYLPVHQDGTCNGLQHYAALGGDVWGARQVNLEPGDRPADVYTAVADLVKAQIGRDIKLGVPLAKALDGKVTRKVVKQTVMTNVYGVTYAGARSQVCKQLDDLYPNLERETGIGSMVLASYIAKLIFSALSNMFGGAHEIQSWLGEIGGRVCTALMPEQLERISSGATTVAGEGGDQPKLARKTKKPKKSKKAKDGSGGGAGAGEGSDQPPVNNETLPAEFQTTIVWTTPLSMPVSQPYRKTAKRIISTCLQDVHLTTPDGTEPVNRRKQLQAFPPNFIHSLDASHMLLSAIECDVRGLNFAAVHDSFWTHACDVDVMNIVLRDAFVRIHSEDVVGRLRTEFQARYANSMYHAKVDMVSPAGIAIREWRHGRRMTSAEELILEYRRLKMLASEDPDEVRQAREMETPGTIFERLRSHDSSELTAIEDMSGTRIGEVSDAADAEADTDASSSPRGRDEDDFEDDEGAAVDELGEMGGQDEAAGVGSLMSGAGAIADEVMKSMHVSGFKSIVVEGKKWQTKVVPTVALWLPLEFPPIPAKGEFDVAKLKHSEYFFS